MLKVKYVTSLLLCNLKDALCIFKVFIYFLITLQVMLLDLLHYIPSGKTQVLRNYQHSKYKVNNYFICTYAIHYDVHNNHILIIINTAQ